MTTVHHQVLIYAPLKKVYEALSSAEKIGTWWDKQTATQTDVGLVLEHNPGSEHGIVKLRVVEMIPNRRVEWECISTHPQTSPASVWTGTHFIFELEERNDSTILDFFQTDYPEQSKFFNTNKTAWKQVLQNLKQMVES